MKMPLQMAIAEYRKAEGVKPFVRDVSIVGPQAKEFNERVVAGSLKLMPKWLGHFGPARLTANP